MAFVTVFKRYELKYLLDDAQLQHRVIINTRHQYDPCIYFGGNRDGNRNPAVQGICERKQRRAKHLPLFAGFCQHQLYWRPYCAGAFWREYPDLFVDFMVRGNSTEVKEGEFRFYFY